MNHWGKGRFKALSAGSFPKGQVHPLALEHIFTVCDNAAGEVCPVWSGKPMTAHWGDRGSGGGRRLRKAFKELETRIKLLIELPIASLDQLTLNEKLRAIGREPSPTID